MTDCIFCRIASGEIPATIVYKDDKVVAFRDLNPQAPVHILVIPIKHVISFGELGSEDDSLTGHLVRICAQLAYSEGIADRGYRVVTNCGRAAGQSVDHLHFHLLGGRGMNWPPG